MEGVLTLEPAEACEAIAPCLGRAEAEGCIETGRSIGMKGERVVRCTLTYDDGKRPPRRAGRAK